MLTGKAAVIKTVTEELLKEKPEWSRIIISLNSQLKYEGKELVTIPVQKRTL